MIAAELCVGRKRCKEFLMCADLRMALIHPDDLIHLVEQIEAMGNEDYNRVFCQLL